MKMFPMSGLVEHILHVPTWLALLVVFAMPALEASTFLGFIFPGEIACLLGGVLAYENKLSLAVVIIVMMMLVLAGHAAVALFVALLVGGQSITVPVAIVQVHGVGCAARH